MSPNDIAPRPLSPSGRYDRSRVTAGIAHMSVGNFHRAHQACYVEQILALSGHEHWGILGIGLLDVPSERAKADALRRQSGLYSLTAYPPEGTPKVSVIGSIVDYLHAPNEPEAVLRRLADPAIRIVTMTVTEGGYNRDDAGRFRLESPDIVHDLAGGLPRTVFGFITEALHRRRRAGAGPFTVMSCDNLRHNGRVIEAALLSFARARDPGLADWIQRTVTFPSCMVDRITPATAPADVARLNAASGFDDAAPVFAEDFIQWVIEDRFCAGRPRWEEVGVQFTGDVDPYEQVKLRMLNASHSVMAYPAVLIGHRLVHEAVADPELRAFLSDFLQRDAGPLLDAPPGMSTRSYGELLLRRYSNTAIGDQVLRIASDGISKLPVFLRDTATAILDRGGDHRRIAFALAAFAEYLGGKDDAGATFAVNEPGYTSGQAALVEDPDPARALELDAFKGWDLGSRPAFRADFAAFRRGIRSQGAKRTLSMLMTANR